MNKIKVAIIGPGNIGSDLMAKINKSKNMEMALMVGIRESDNIKRVRAQGVPVTIGGVQDLVTHPEIQIVFDATSASAHLAAAPILAEAGMIALDLTPAAVGPYLVPAVNFESLKDAINVNLVTCGGQATIPIVYAVSRVAGAKYAEIVACISSPSAGPGTRQSIDEFTQTTAKAVVQVGGADRGKAIIILNPAEPPIIMTNTIYVQVKDPTVGVETIQDSVERMVCDLQAYVPGYRLRVPALLEGDKVTVSVEVEGAGDYLPTYSGNLDIINSAAIAYATKVADRLLREKEVQNG